MFFLAYFNPRSPRGERHGKIIYHRPVADDFNPRSPRGERRADNSTKYRYLKISIHAPRVGSDVKERLLCRRPVIISIHAPRVGSDSNFSSLSVIALLFQSTLPAWGATASSKVIGAFQAFQSTLPAWGATPLRARSARARLFQSTLPAWGATLPAGFCAKCTRYFNPRSPRGERPSCPPDTASSDNFNPRSPRGERLYATPTRATDGSYFNPRSPRGERHWIRSGRGSGQGFQSTLPAWGATAIIQNWPLVREFQSTLPAWGATGSGGASGASSRISIHAPRVGSDHMRMA